MMSGNTAAEPEGNLYKIFWICIYLKHCARKVKALCENAGGEIKKCFDFAQKYVDLSFRVCYSNFEIKFQTYKALYRDQRRGETRKVVAW